MLTTNEGLITDPKFHERLEKSYPIHPDFVDMLYERVSTISQFNQTRGTLRFLALVLNDIYANQRNCTLVGTGDINLESPEIVDEITSKIGRNEFAKIINTDCIEHARGLDGDKPVKIIEQVARTIYLHSLHETPNKKSGITISRIKLSVGRPGFDTSLIEKSLYESIKTQFWYIQETNDQFYFVDSINENAIIAEYAKRVNPTETDEQIRHALVGLTGGSSFKPIIWDGEVEDSSSLKMYVFRHDEQSNIKKRIFDILEHVNGKPRNYSNTIAFVYADSESVADLKSAAKELAAIFKAKKDERIKADKNFLKNIGQKETQARGNLNSICIKTYCRIGYPDGPEPRLDVMPYGDMTGKAIGDLVREFLQSKGKLIPEIGCDAISVDSYKKLEDIYNEFLSDKRQKFVEKTNSIKDAAREGVSRGIFGYSDILDESEQRHRGHISKEVDVKFSGYIIHKNHLVDSAVSEDPPPDESTDPKPDSPASFAYKIPIRSLDDIQNNIDNLLVGDFKNIQKNLRVEIDIIGSTKIVLSSTMEDLSAIKNITSNLRSYQEGQCDGYLNLYSDSDIADMLKENGMGYE